MDVIFDIPQHTHIALHFLHRYQESDLLWHTHVPVIVTPANTHSGILAENLPNGFWHCDL
jgi:hypothetical protein